MMKLDAGLYIHVPFCRSKCPYCDFYSLSLRDELRREFVAAVRDEIITRRRSRQFLQETPRFDTIYFGGGTPSVLKAEDFDSLLSTIYSNLSISDNAEITVECNPSSTDFSLLSSLKSCGVNRISIGMQSAVDRERRALGRAADSACVLDCIDSARRAGIDNISLDIMLGIPHQSLTSLEQSLSFCTRAEVPHISAYILSIEPNTVFDRRKSSLPLPEEDELCRMHELMHDFLTAHSYEHYEISNFAKQNRQSRHNIKYWLGGAYWGIGPAAHSFIDKKRFYFDRDLQAFIDGRPAQLDCIGGDEEEFIMLRLRLSQGLSFEAFRQSFDKEIDRSRLEKMKFYAQKGFASLDEFGFALNERGFLLSNKIISDILFA